MARAAVGHFRDRDAAQTAYDALLRSGFVEGDVSVVERGEDGGGSARTGDVSAGEGAAVGGLAGLLVGTAAMLIPGIGPLVAVGPLASALAGAITGGVTGVAVGSLTAALVDLGVDEDAARSYDDRTRAGGVLVVVRAEDVRYADACLVLHEQGADLRAAPSGEANEPPQTVGASPGASGQPTPAAVHVGEDAGLVDTPLSTPTGTTDSIDTQGKSGAEAEGGRGNSMPTPRPSP